MENTPSLFSFTRFFTQKILHYPIDYNGNIIYSLFVKIAQIAFIAFFAFIAFIAFVLKDVWRIAQRGWRVVGNNSIYETKSRVFTTEAEVEA
jgi:hypothetical protein